MVRVRASSAAPKKQQKVISAYGLDKALAYRKYIVNLPCSTNLSFEDCDRVIEAVLGL